MIRWVQQVGITQEAPERLTKGRQLPSLCIQIVRLVEAFAFSIHGSVVALTGILEVRRGIGPFEQGRVSHERTGAEDGVRNPPLPRAQVAQPLVKPCDLAAQTLYALCARSAA